MTIMNIFKEWKNFDSETSWMYFIKKKCKKKFAKIEKFNNKMKTEELRLYRDQSGVI